MVLYNMFCNIYNDKNMIGHFFREVHDKLRLKIEKKYYFILSTFHDGISPIIKLITYKLLMYRI